VAATDERTARIEELYEAFNRRDIEAVLATLTSDVDWPNVLEGTRALGRDAVRQYWLRQFEVIDPRVEPIDFVARGDTLVVDVHQVVRDLEGNVTRDGRVAHVYSFRDRHVQRMDVYPSIEEALAALDDG
jgi:hypothetical protein